MKPWTPAWYTPPKTDADCLADPWWRLCNLYRVVDEDGVARQFVPNVVQVNYYWHQWYLNLILKSRQHGFTTFLCLVALDKCIFRKNYHAHLLAHTREDSEKIFEEKIRWPLEQLIEEHPEMTVIAESEEENARVLRFPDDSVFSCGTSMRGGTLQWLHVSEHGKICAKFPDKAKEIRSGSLNTVHPGQNIVIESTAEGRQGDFYDFSERAKKQAAGKTKLSKLDFKFHFYPWWKDPKNVLDPRGVTITDGYRKYLRDLQKREGVRLTPGQKAWYVKKAEVQKDLMYREHPSTPQEAFQGATEGAIYGSIMILLRKQGRIVPEIPFDTRVPVDTTWDLGKNNMNAIWLHQYIRAEGVHRWLWFLYSHKEDGRVSNSLGANGPADWVNALDELRGEFRFKWGRHYLPHDVEVSDWSQAKGVTRRDVLEGLGMTNVVTVERVPELQAGIAVTKQILSTSVFSERGCADGITFLENYRFDWDERVGAYKDQPAKGPPSDAADAMRQLAQEWFPEETYKRRKKRNRNWRTA